MVALTIKDKEQLERINITTEQVENQVNQFINGFPFSDLIAPATINNGIVKFDEKEIKELINQFEEDKQYYDILKFIPASGAASRMFKDLYAFVEEYKDKEIPDNFLRKEKFSFIILKNYLE